MKSQAKIEEIKNWIEKYQASDSLEIISRFGGVKKIDDAVKSKLLDDIYCWETEKWYTARYWEHHKMSTQFTGITMGELYYRKKHI
ncbi:hypothetical protein [Acinetobacter baumannii]|uniref:hypothetical protein n=1 Tax=Acinetobacter baumannii TaxID=470 RepID=UPI00338E123F